MDSRYLRFALWAFVVVLVAVPASSLAGVQATTPNYTLSGYVNEPGGFAMPKAGVTVDLISSTSHQTLTALTQSGGLFSFSGGALTPGWWGLWVPPQTGLQLGGSTQWAVIPNGSAPQYYWLSSANLTSLLPELTTTATLLQLTGNITGTATFADGSPAAEATVAVHAPTLAGFELNNTTTNATGGFSFRVPPGTWILQTTYYGTTTQYNTTMVTVGSHPLLVNPIIEDYAAYGNIFERGTIARASYDGNVSVYDPATGTILSEPTLPGSYSIGTYPAGFTGPGAENLVVLVNPSGYETVGYIDSVSPTSPTDARNVYVIPQAPPADYNTTLVFSPTFGKLSVTTVAKLGNDSVFPDLANASVGQLWAQLGLDFNDGQLSFNGADPAEVAAVQDWLARSGPFFAAGQSGLNVNGTTYGQPDNDTFVAPAVPATTLDYTSSAGMAMSWNQSYNETDVVQGGGNSHAYTIAFTFRHPTGPQAINYTIDLPKGYTLAADTLKPANAVLVPEGANRTWTNFTMVAQQVPAGQPSWGQANFTVVKYAGINAIVNVTTSSFDFSALNVLNKTRSNYTAVVGTGQNTTFSALNSTYPDGTNGTLFRWNFGGVTETTTGPVAWHT
ncbi:MAG: carboxypeptidase-like regulatory domain-containing protein, partial [Thermoplasmata archaeon]